MVFGRLVECRTKEYSSINRSLRSLEREGLLQRVFIQLRWRRTTKAAKVSSDLMENKPVMEKTA